MIQAKTQIDRQVQKTKSREGKYLAFAFLEKDTGMELEIVGWTKLRPKPDKPDYIRGVVNPWRCEIPIIDLGILYGKGATEISHSACIVIFEHSDPYKYYFGTVVEELSNVINIADGTENKMSSLLLAAKRHLSISPAVKN
ncbi:MAG: chemotaxis protein CheW [Planctomycetota bacterium]|jgi:chemotaxis signal transduction protein